MGSRHGHGVSDYFFWRAIRTKLTAFPSGNNVVAYKGSTSSTTPESSSGSFVYTQNPSQAPTVAANLDAARTNAFYLVNTVHDISYLYGFTESAFNFQNDNGSKGGKGNDRVTVSVQDSAGTEYVFPLHSIAFHPAHDLISNAGKWIMDSQKDIAQYMCEPVLLVQTSGKLFRRACLVFCLMP
jgi:hypothetical protein